MFKKYLFMLLALVGFTASAQIYEAVAISNGDNLQNTQPLNYGQRIKFKITNSVVEAKFSDGQERYWTFSNDYTASNGYYVRVYNGNNGFKLLYIAELNMIGTTEFAYHLEPRSYYLEIGDKGDDDDDEVVGGNFYVSDAKGGAIVTVVDFEGDGTRKLFIPDSQIGNVVQAFIDGYGEFYISGAVIIVSRKDGTGHFVISKGGAVGAYESQSVMASKLTTLLDYAFNN